MLASPCFTSESSRKFGSLTRMRSGIGRMLLRHLLLAHIDDGIDAVLDVPDGMDMPSWRIVPAIFPLGHHIRVTRAPVPSTVPLQIARSGLMSTLVRLIVRTVLSLRVTAIFGKPSFGIAGQHMLEHLGSAAPSPALTPMVDLAALARFHDKPFCLSGHGHVVARRRRVEDAV